MAIFCFKAAELILSIITQLSNLKYCLTLYIASSRPLYRKIKIHILVVNKPRVHYLLQDENIARVKLCSPQNNCLGFTVTGHPLYFTIQLSTEQTFQLKINSPWLASERHHQMLPGTLSLFLVKTEQISDLQAVERVPRVHGMYLCKGKKKKTILKSCHTRGFKLP